MNLGGGITVEQIPYVSLHHLYSMPDIGVETLKIFSTKSSKTENSNETIRFKVAAPSMHISSCEIVEKLIDGITSTTYKVNPNIFSREDDMKPETIQKQIPPIEDIKTIVTFLEKEFTKQQTRPSRPSGLSLERIREGLACSGENPFSKDLTSIRD